MSNANAPAFPLVNEMKDHWGNVSQEPSPGLNKREYAAIQIAAGMCGGESETEGYWKNETLAARAVARADALLAELSKYG